MENNNMGSMNSEKGTVGVNHTENANKRRSVRKITKRRNILKIVLVSLISFLLIISCAGAAIVMPLLQSYNDSYHNVPIVTRPYEYSRPPLPTGIYTDTDELPDDPSVDTSNGEDEENGNGGYSGGSTVTVSGIYYVKQKDPDVENILVVGVDGRNMLTLSGRTDTMLVCSYNRRTGKAKLASLLRDSLVYIEPLKKYQRLNAAFSLGNIAVTINTINQTFGLDIQRFVIINFLGTEKLVDACGGVDMKLTTTGSNNEKSYIESLGGKPVKNSDGTYHLDGKAALIHMRQRAGSSDIKRTQRQRNVITAIFRQVVESKDLTQIYDLVRLAFSMVKTNIPIEEMIDLAGSVVGNGSNMSIGSKSFPTSFSFRRFNMSKQVFVSSGGASIISFDFESQEKEMAKFIYG